MEEYDPDASVNPAEWLSLPEDERLILIKGYHERERIPLPNEYLHAAIHLVVENQLAEEYDPTQRAMRRLLDEGLGRHDAIHAIGTVLAEYLFEIKKGRKWDDMEDAFEKDLDRLNRKAYEDLARDVDE